MDAHIQLGTDVEVEFELLDANGKKLIDSKKLNNAVLKVTPIFYQGMQSQTWARNCTQNSKGRKVRQFMRLSGQTGKHMLQDCDEDKKRITPKFDSLEAKKTNATGKPGSGSGGSAGTGGSAGGDPK
jgi:hypothetical protein